MKIALLLSGGVDSSVALYKLLSENHEVEVFYLKIWLEDETSFLGDCPWEEDLSYARAVCDLFSVKLNVISLQNEYYDKVVSYVLNELKNGFTPSPDIFCNQMIKFGVFFKKLEKFKYDFDKVASGHYAKIEKGDDGIFRLFCAIDSVKDQTYFLSFLSQEQLSRIYFPLQNMKKEEIRELANKINLPNKTRKDSQGICFLGKIKYNDFVRYYLKSKKGEIRNLRTGEVLGFHDGFWFHTIGQRTGLKLSGGPWYVAKKNSKENIIFVSHKDDILDCFKDEIIIFDLNWLAGFAPDFLKINDENLKIKLRHGPKMYNARLQNLENGRVLIKMEEKDSGIAAGQFAVIYHKNECLGAGKIILEEF